MSSTPPLQRDLPALGLILAAVIAVMLIGGQVTFPQIAGWYAGLSKPSWTPPNWLFGPVWTALYLMMAVAAWLVWRRRRQLRAAPPLLLWSIQLALNLAWSILFFGLHLVFFALIDIAVLAVAIAATALLFWRARRVAALLLLPYLAWTLYAASLNAGILALN